MNNIKANIILSGLATGETQDCNLRYTRAIEHIPNESIEDLLRRVRPAQDDVLEIRIIK